MSSPSKPIADALGPGPYKLVITRNGGSVIKGIVPNHGITDLDSLLAASDYKLEQVLPEHFAAKVGSLSDIPWNEVKAAFFVTSFEGDSEQHPVRFFGRGPEVGRIWVEVVFVDGEVMEGCMDNSLDFLTRDGFFLHPSDPKSNNRLIYVNKSSLRNFRVIGVLSAESE